MTRTAAAATGPVILRRVSGVRTDGDAQLLDVQALPAVTIDPMPGWITGEPLEDQGIETTMPNLPDIELPDVTPVPFAIRVAAVAPDTVRVTIAPTGSPAVPATAPGWASLSTQSPNPLPRSTCPPTGTSSCSANRCGW